MSQTLTDTAPPATSFLGASTRLDDRELSDRDLHRLHVEYVETADPRICEQLVRHYQGLAIAIARRMAKSSTDREDIQQVAMLGLFQSVQRFDPARDIRFSTFAWRTIEGEIKRYFRDKVSLVHVPRPLQERAAAVGNAIEELSHSLQRSPTTAEIGTYLHLAEEEVIEALEVQRNSRPLSVDHHDADDESTAPINRLGEIDGDLESSDQRSELSALVAQLPEREQRVFLLRFEEDLTQSEIAKRVGVSQMQVSRLLAASHAHLRAAMTAND